MARNRKKDSAEVLGLHATSRSMVCAVRYSGSQAASLFDVHNLPPEGMVVFTIARNGFETVDVFSPLNRETESTWIALFTAFVDEAEQD